jgi:hypothetical protein
MYLISIAAWLSETRKVVVTLLRTNNTGSPRLRRFGHGNREYPNACTAEDFGKRLLFGAFNGGSPLFEHQN